MTAKTGVVAGQVAVLRKELSAHGVLTFDRKDAVARWRDAIDLLITERFCTAKLVSTGEQSTALEVRRST